MDEILRFFQDNKMAFDLHLLRKGTYSLTVYGLGSIAQTGNYESLEEMICKLNIQIENYLAE